MTKNKDIEINIDVHKKLGKECFNKAWEYLDKSSLTSEEELIMLNLAHTARFHWSKFGTPRNYAISDWQISRCYAKINDGVSALKYAQSNLKLLLDNKIEDLYVSGYEGLARAYAIIKDYKNAKKYISIAEEELSKVTDKEDIAIFEPQINDTKLLIK